MEYENGCLPMLVDLDIRKYTFLCKLLSPGNLICSEYIIICLVLKNRLSVWCF